MGNNKKFQIAMVLALLAFCIPSQTGAVDITRSGFLYSHFAGGRAGAWVMTTDEDAIDEIEDFSSSSLYAEFFYAHRISPLLSAELSIGIFSQGDLQFITNDILVDAIKIYPILISGKMYPLSGVSGLSMHPYLRAGGGLVYGTRDISTAYYYDLANDYIEETQTRFTWLAGVGIDWPVSQQIGLNLDFKYVPVDFGDALGGLEDYSGWELTVGVGYIFKSK